MKAAKSEGSLMSSPSLAAAIKKSLKISQTWWSARKDCTANVWAQLDGGCHWKRIGSLKPF